MRSPDKSGRLAYLAVLIAVGSALWIFEELLPRPVPWVKPGLANIATIITIYLLGPWDGIPVALGRVIIGSLVLGRFGSAGFLMSLSGALVSAVTMGTLRRTGAPLSIYGVSLCGSLVHGLAQLLVAAWLVNFPGNAYNLLPWVALPALPTGLLTGFISAVLIGRMPDKFRTRLNRLAGYSSGTRGQFSRTNKRTGRKNLE